MNYKNTAKILFEEHYNCAQSVFCSFAEHFNLGFKTAARIATPFGGGIGHSGHMCGAISGGIMAIGLARGIEVYNKENKDACYALAHEFLTRFSALHGSVTCPGLLGIDISDPIALQQARDQDLFHTLCPEFVGDAARLIAELLGL